MKKPRGILFGLSLTIALLPSAIAQTTSPDANTQQLLANIFTAFSGGKTVASVTMQGTARAIAGSTDESGTFTFDLKENGESTFHLSAGALTRTESTGASGAKPACTWTGADGVQHDSAQHNCLLPVSWIIPVLGLQSQSNKLNKSISAGTDRGYPVHILSLSQRPIDSSIAGQRFAELSSAKLSFDTATMLARLLTFDVHPDKDEGLNIPIVARYSDYRQVNGAALPFHIEKYLNDGLVLDLHVQSASVQ